MPQPKAKAASKAKVGPETKTRKPKDFTESAENLCNPPDVFKLLNKLHKHQAVLATLEDSIPAELRAQMGDAKELITDTIDEIKSAVKKSGSFQDIEAEHYAVRYRSIRKEYLAKPFAKQYEKLAPAVIVDAVNVEVLEQLIRGGVIAEADLKAKGIISEKITHSFYIR